MVKVTFNEPNTDNWNDWKKRCISATQKLIENTKKGIPTKITDLYKEQKAVFLDTYNNFHGKCVYCESLIPVNQPGDVEHFRPKGRITDSENKPILIDKGDGVQIPHPGYYWLAYNFKNLLPSCTDCNRPSSGNSGGTLIGKWDQFPVRGNNALTPGEEIHEQPLLINPVDENPDDHLMIDDLGILHPKDDRGDKCIKIFGLNLRQSLVDERKRTYENVKKEAMLQIIKWASGFNDNSHILEIQLYQKGKRPYSIAGKKAVEDYKIENPDILNFFKP